MADRTSWKFATSRRLVVALAALWTAGLLADGPAQEVRGEDWMFRRSYYSHERPPGEPPGYPLPRSRAAYRPAYVGQNPGFAIRGAHRFNTIYLRSGNSVDVTILREDWFNLRP